MLACMGDKDACMGDEDACMSDEAAPRCTATPASGARDNVARVVAIGVRIDTPNTARASAVAVVTMTDVCSGDVDAAACGVHVRTE